jgi:hypothetical protein
MPRELRIPTLVITGEEDLVPVEVAERIACALANAQLVSTPDCGQFACLECSGAVQTALDDFFRRTAGSDRNSCRIDERRTASDKAAPPVSLLTGSAGGRTLEHDAARCRTMRGQSHPEGAPTWERSGFSQSVACSRLLE